MEIEVKILDIEPQAIREKLKVPSCEFIEKVFQRNLMYDYADRRLYDTLDGSYIRLRETIHFDTGDRTVLLTFKKVVSREKYKIAEEIESYVEDLGAMQQFLEALGLEHQRTDEKIRESYQWGDIRFEIDEWAGLPPYLEVEATSEAAVEKGLQFLGYSLEDSTSKNLQEVLDLYKIKDEVLTFSKWGRNIQTEIEEYQHAQGS